MGCVQYTCQVSFYLLVKSSKVQNCEKGVRQKDKADAHRVKRLSRRLSRPVRVSVVAPLVRAVLLPPRLVLPVRPASE